MDKRNNFLCKLTEEGLLVIKHVVYEANDGDIFAQNTTPAIFDTHLFTKDQVKYGGRMCGWSKLSFE